MGKIRKNKVLGFWCTCVGLMGYKKLDEMVEHGTSGLLVGLLFLAIWLVTHLGCITCVVDPNIVGTFSKFEVAILGILHLNT